MIVRVLRENNSYIAISFSWDFSDTEKLGQIYLWIMEGISASCTTEVVDERKDQRAACCYAYSLDFPLSWLWDGLYILIAIYLSRCPCVWLNSFKIPSLASDCSINSFRHVPWAAAAPSWMITETERNRKYTEPSLPIVFLWSEYLFISNTALWYLAPSQVN